MSYTMVPDSVSLFFQPFTIDSRIFSVKGTSNRSISIFSLLLFALFGILRIDNKIYNLSSRLFHVTVAPPSTTEEVQKIANIYAMLGIPGAVGSTDCTHIPLGKCPVSWRNSCIGKEGFPTLSYSMTCDHTRRIMACSGGFPGSYNDKTIARYDSFISEVAQNSLFTNFKYDVETKNGVIEKTGCVYLSHLIHYSHY